MSILVAMSSWFGFPSPNVPEHLVGVASTTTQSGALATSPEATSTSNAPQNVLSVGASDSVSTPTTLPAGSSWLTVLPLGDYHYVTNAPKKGYVYLCKVSPDGQGAQKDGPWIQGNVWYPSQKVSAQGSVSWPNASVKITLAGAFRDILTNDLPVGATTGIFPTQSTDPAYAYDANPNSIEAQSLSVNLPANPVVTSTPNCIYGEVGIMTNGVLLLDAFDAEYRDAAAHEILDSCDGHAHTGGMYHYHDLSSCISDTDETTIVGWAFDGFPITGPKLPDGNYLTTSDLDECHGITSPITEDAKTVTTYHYVMTQDFPYSVSCFRGKSYEPMPGMQMGTSANTGNASGGSMQDMTQSSGQMGGSPPQAAITACASLKTGSSCSFSGTNGNIPGTCETPPGMSSLACVPAQH
jgi:hypothetical protein